MECQQTLCIDRQTYVDLHKRMLIFIVYTYFKVKALGFLVYIRELQLASKMHITDANIQWQPSRYSVLFPTEIPNHLCLSLTCD